MYLTICWIPGKDLKYESFASYYPHAAFKLSDSRYQMPDKKYSPECGTYIWGMEEKIFQPRVLYLAKLSFRIKNITSKGNRLIMYKARMNVKKVK